MLNSILLLAILGLAPFAKGANFSRGNIFQLSNLNGSLTVQCEGKQVTVVCRDVFMNPWPYDIFIGPAHIDAKKVELQAKVGDETQYSVVDYDGKIGRSDEINLGVSSLFQKPLLKLGQNEIRYVLLDKNNKVIQTDKFAVTVERGQPRTCDARVAMASSSEDCDYPYSLCQAYFKEQNYCQ